MQYRSISDLSMTIARHLDRIPRGIDLVVGIPRSGLLVANIVALHLNLPVADLEGFLYGRLLATGKTKASEHLVRNVADCKRVLVVDDSIWSGAEMARARSAIDASGMSVGRQILYGAAYLAPGMEPAVDFYLEVCPLPRIFEWNLFHHDLLSEACLDIDGVLCIDPTEEQNDDGPAYCQFIGSATPLWVPTKPVGTLVTARLEKYRKLTEQWLAVNRIQYRKLIMLDLPDKATRQKLGMHGVFKAEIYKQSEALLFIESSLSQARTIAALTHKPVFSIEERRMLNCGDRRAPITFASRCRRRLKRVGHRFGLSI